MSERAAVVKRVSSTKQEAESQHRVLAEWVLARAYEVVTTIVMGREGGRRRNVSAIKGEQAPYLEAILEAVRAGLYTVVVFHDMSRQDRRGILDTLQFICDVRKAGGRVEFAAQPWLDTSGPQGDVNVANMAHAIKMESDMRTLKTAEGVAAARANGAITNLAPWGYEITGPKRNKRYVPTQDGRHWIPPIFAAIIGGMSLRACCKWLTEEKAGGRTWYTPNLSRLLHNPAYKGFVTDKSGAIVSRCEELVDAGLWDACQAALASTSRKATGRTPKAALAGLRCLHCGSAAYRDTSGGPRGGRYYRCEVTGCAAGMREHALDALASDVIAGITAPVWRRVAVPGRNWDAEIAAIDFELSRLGLAGLDEDAEDARRAELRAEKRRLAALPAVPDTWRMVPTGETVGGRWQRMSSEARTAWLKSGEVRVLAAKGEHPGHGRVVRDGLTVEVRLEDDGYAYIAGTGDRRLEVDHGAMFTAAGEFLGMAA